MKKIFIILMTLVLTSSFSQVTPEIKYPKFEVDALGQKVIVMTIPQAMKLNNNSDILEKFEEQDIKIKEYENLCVKVISEKDEAIAKLDLVISKQDSQLLIKDDKIKSLQGEILAWLAKNGALEKQLANRQQVIDEQKSQLSRLKIKMVVGGIGGAAIIIPLVLKVVGIIK